MEMLGTKYCINCGKPATLFAGHLKAKQKMAFGKLANVKVGAGWCSVKCHDAMQSDGNGCYGEYDNVMELTDINL